MSQMATEKSRFQAFQVSEPLEGLARGETSAVVPSQDAPLLWSFAQVTAALQVGGEDEYLDLDVHIHGYRYGSRAVMLGF